MNNWQNLPAVAELGRIWQDGNNIKTNIKTNKSVLFLGDVNIALNKPAWQSSTHGSGTIAGRAVHGDNSIDFRQDSCSHTKENGDPIPWLI